MTLKLPLYWEEKRALSLISIANGGNIDIVQLCEWVIRLPEDKYIMKWRKCNFTTLYITTTYKCNNLLSVQYSLRANSHMLSWKFLDLRFLSVFQFHFLVFFVIFFWFNFVNTHYNELQLQCISKAKWKVRQHLSISSRQWALLYVKVSFISY